MVFYGIVCAALQVLRNNGPLILVQTVLNVQNKLLLETPVVFLDAWVEMIVPALTALLTDATRKIMGNVGPFCCAISLHERQHQLVLIL